MSINPRLESQLESQFDSQLESELHLDKLSINDSDLHFKDNIVDNIVVFNLEQTPQYKDLITPLLNVNTLIDIYNNALMSRDSHTFQFLLIKNQGIYKFYTWFNLATITPIYLSKDVNITSHINLINNFLARTIKEEGFDYTIANRLRYTISYYYPVELCIRNSELQTSITQEDMFKYSLPFKSKEYRYIFHFNSDYNLIAQLEKNPFWKPYNPLSF